MINKSDGLIESQLQLEKGHVLCFVFKVKHEGSFFYKIVKLNMGGNKKESFVYKQAGYLDMS